MAGEAASALVQFQVSATLGWIARKQLEQDHGIDLQVEKLEAGIASGRLLALQVKGGPSYFSKPTKGGWIHKVSKRHADYWTNHSLPVVLVLVDLVENRMYWAHVNNSTLIPSGNNFKIVVPADQELAGAKARWSELVDDAFIDNSNYFSSNLHQLPPYCGGDLKELNEANPNLAAILAAEYVQGRADPRPRAETVLRVHADWLDRGGIAAWRSLAHFAQEHGAFRVACEAFIRCSELDGVDRAAHLAHASLVIANSDAGRARSLLESALADDKDRIDVVAIRAALDLEVLDSASLRYDPTIYSKLTESKNNALVLSVLASHAVRKRDDSAAISYYEACLSEQPSASAIMIALSTEYMKRSATESSQSTDLSRSELLAGMALAQQRLWTDDTDDALSTKLNALGLQSKFGEVLNAALLPPEGTATPSEVRSAEVARLAIGAALQLDQRHLVAQIIDCVGSENSRDELTREFQSYISEDPYSEREQIRGLIATMTAPVDKQLLVRRVVRLALLGEDASPALSEGVKDGSIPSSYSTLVSVIVGAIKTPGSNTRELRALAETEPVAADLLVKAYEAQERFEDALHVARKAALRFHNGSFILHEFRMLELLGRSEDARATLEEALTTERTTGTLRTVFRTILAELAARDSDWPKATRLFELVVHENDHVSPTAEWNLLHCYLALAAYDKARTLADRISSAVESDDQARAWLHTVQMTGWDSAAARKAVALARQFSSDPSLSGALIASVIQGTRHTELPGDADINDRRPLVDPEIHTDAYKVLDELQKIHGDMLPMYRIDAPDAEAALNSIFEMVKQSGGGLKDKLAREVRRGVIPLGFLAQISHRSYTAVVIARPLGVRVAVSPDDATHGVEMDAAQASIESRVVVDVSALELASDLAKFEELKSHFSDVVVTRSLKSDAARASGEGRTSTASSKSLTFDPWTGQIVVHEVDSSLSTEFLSKILTIAKLIDGLPDVDIDGPYEILTDLNDKPATHSERVKLSFRRGSAPWAEPIELAARSNIALWSDDVGQRMLARAFGVPTFGTVALIDSLRLDAITTATNANEVDALAGQQRTHYRQLAEKRVADIPMSLNELLNWILEQGDRAQTPHDILSSGSWWRDRDALTTWLDLRGAAPDMSSESLTVLQFRCFEGIAADSTRPPQSARRAMASIALSGVTDRDSAADVVEALERVAYVCFRAEIATFPGLVAEAMREIDELGIIELGDPEWRRQILAAPDPQPSSQETV